jgi:hypothetical protein
MHKFGDSADFAGAINAGKNTAAFSQQYSIPAAGELIRMHNLTGGNIRAGCLQLQFFIILGRTTVFYMQFGNNKEYPCFFEVFVCNSIGPQEFRSPHLKPDRINAVVNHAAFVGLSVSRHNGYRMTLDPPAAGSLRKTHFAPSAKNTTKADTYKIQLIKTCLHAQIKKI